MKDPLTRYAQEAGIGYPRKIATHIRGLLAIGMLLLLGGCSVLSNLRGPATPFSPSETPPAPDYRLTNAWLAIPGRAGLELSSVPGIVPKQGKQLEADVFFIHPTTYKGSDVWNAPFDASDIAAPLNPAVLLGQVSVFNDCCRLFAPRYRQATLAGLNNDQAMNLAYTDIAQAFRFFIAHQNGNRPFVIASHSQGTAHAIKLLQQEILDTPLRKRLVAAYLIGGYVPDNFAEVGLPTCNDARQVGCVLSYNTSQTGRSGARMLIDDKTYWWKGANKREGQAPALCVNPLSWEQQGSAPREANAGSLPFPEAPFPAGPQPLAALTPHLTGAECRNGLLEVDIPGSSAAQFRDVLSWVTGSYHLNDYGIFYANLRRNVQDRVDAWVAGNPAGSRD